MKKLISFVAVAALFDAALLVGVVLLVLYALTHWVEPII